MDESAFVGGGGAHGLEVGDGEGYVLAVEAEDDAAEGEGVGAEGGDVVGEGPVGAEVVGAEAEVEVDAFGDCGVRHRRRQRRRRRRRRR